MTGVLVRDAGPEDRPTVLRFFAALQDLERAREPNRLPGADCADEHVAALEAWAADGGGNLFAEVGGVPAGWLIFGIETETGAHVPPETRRKGVLSDLWIEPAFRRRGVTLALIGEAERRLSAAGIRRVEVSTLPSNGAAIAAYRALGYLPALTTLAKPLGGA